jgi:hypothetical protein
MLKAHGHDQGESDVMEGILNSNYRRRKTTIGVVLIYLC